MLPTLVFQHFSLLGCRANGRTAAGKVFSLKLTWYFMISKLTAVIWTFIQMGH